MNVSKHVLKYLQMRPKTNPQMCSDAKICLEHNEFNYKWHNYDLVTEVGQIVYKLRKNSVHHLLLNWPLPLVIFMRPRKVEKGVIHKPCGQDFDHFWPPTYSTWTSMDISLTTYLCPRGNLWTHPLLQYAPQIFNLLLSSLEIFVHALRMALKCVDIWS